MATKKKSQPQAERVELASPKGTAVTVGSDVVEKYTRRGYTDPNAKKAPAKATATKAPAGGES